MEPDFGGWATKANLKCSDGRTILSDTFKHMDGFKVPLVWMHDRKDPENVLGHVVMEHRDEGMYVKGYFNETPRGIAARTQVIHKDLDSLSIWANRLVEKIVAGGKEVVHGMIHEVSLVLSGANPGAKIDFVRIAHSSDPDDYTELTDEATIEPGFKIEVFHAADMDAAKPDSQSDNTDNGVSLEQAYNDLSPEAQNVVNALVEAALEAGAAEHSDDSGTSDDDTTTTDDADGSDGTNEEGDLNHQEGTVDVTRNVFDQTDTDQSNQKTLTHAEFRDMAKKAVTMGSLKKAMDEVRLAHGVENIEILFPDAKAISATPEWNKRRTEWVSKVLNGVNRLPFSRFKSLVADITQDEARAKGYIKGEFKKQEWFAVTSRKTGPTTVYKKQQLDRNDILDITDYDVVAWLWGEIRLMLEEEIARAILIGDGRDVGDPDKIDDPMAAASGDGIRSIANEHELYMTTVWVNIDDADSSFIEVIETLLRARRYYKGTGRPDFFTTEQILTEMLLLKDEENSNRRLFRDEADLASALRVNSIIPVEVMENETDVVGVLVNLSDYSVGTDKGGELTRFDDFDIDYNQYKYLMEARLSGGLTKIKSAQVVRKTAAANVLIVPTKPTFNATTGVVTIPTQTGVVYKNGATNATLTAGAQTALAAGDTLLVEAEPTGAFYFMTNADVAWAFKRPAVQP